MDIRTLRNDFPLLKNNTRAYLDSAATSQKPECVISAEAKFYEMSNANPMRGLYPLSVKATDTYEDARRCVASFIGAEADEIVFTRNATESINLVAYSYGLSFVKEGDGIAVSIAEHHSNMLPWRMVAKRTGAEVSYIFCNEDGSFDDAALSEIKEGTKLVAFTHVSNVIGRVNPIEKIIKKAHDIGAVVLIDASQSIPHMGVNVKETDADFVVFSGHKMLGPMGIGVLYAKKHLLDKMPPFLSGGEMIETVKLDSVRYAKAPHKFEAGTVNAAGAAGLAEAIRYMKGIGYDAIQKRDEELTRRAMEGLAGIGHVHITGSKDPDEHNGIISFTIDDIHPHDVAEILSADGIDVRAGHHCAQPLLDHLKVKNTTRASIMFYNTEEEIDRFVNGVSTLRKRMGFS